MNRPCPLALCAIPALACFAFAVQPERSSDYTAWQHQPEKQRCWCTYQYRNGAGQQTYQYVFYYPDAKRSGVYYFQNRAGEIWACCVRPAAPGFRSDSMKWFRRDGGRWVRRADGDCPSPPDGGRRIGVDGGRTLPVIPAPKDFEQLASYERKVALQCHKHLAEVTIKDAAVVGLDFGGSERVDNKSLADLAGLTSLRRLYLDSTRINDAGIQYLGKLPSLTHLDLSRTAITDRGLKRLAGLKSLRTLIVRGCYGITVEGVRGLKKEHGRLLVTWPVGQIHRNGPPLPPGPPPTPPPAP